MRSFIVAPTVAAVWLVLGAGSWAWQRDVGGGARGDAHAVATDATGDVIAAGRIHPADSLYGGFTVVKLAGDSGTERWRRVLSGPKDAGGEARAVAVDGRGDVVAAGHLGTRAASRAQFAVVKLKGATGTEVWRRVVTGGASGGVVEEARAVAVERAGNVVVAGQMTSADDKRQFVVVKLDGNGGTEHWRRVLQCDWAEAVDVALDADGNVVAAGAACPAGDPARSGAFTVVKLDGSSGAEQWRCALDVSGGGMARKVAMDAHGDVLATGIQSSRQTGGHFIVVKLDGKSGSERWRRIVGEPFGGLGNWIAIDGAANVLAMGTTEVAPGIQMQNKVVPDPTKPPEETVVKLDGSTGAEIWRGTIRGPGRPPGMPMNPFLMEEMNGLAVDPAGDALVGGRTLNGVTGFEFTVVKLDGRTGSERWRRIIKRKVTSGQRGWDEAGRLVTDGAGNVVAVGRMGGMTDPHFTVIKLRGSDGALRPAKGVGVRR